MTILLSLMVVLTSMLTTIPLANLAKAVLVVLATVVLAVRDVLATNKIVVTIEAVVEAVDVVVVVGAVVIATVATCVTSLARAAQFLVLATRTCCAPRRLSTNTFLLAAPAGECAVLPYVTGRLRPCHRGTRQCGFHSWSSSCLFWFCVLFSLPRFL